MTNTMKWMCFTVILALSCYEGQATPASKLLKVRTSVVPGEKIQDGMTISVPFQECGYIFCEAPDVFVNGSTHFWDYYIDWEMPAMAESSPSVFVMANRYQMPRSYLVFKSFTANFTGEYRCLLHFRESPLSSLTLTLTLSETVTSKDCSNATR